MEIKKYDEYVPKGWVNIKIDDQLFLRMSKYVEDLDKVVVRKTGRQGSKFSIKDKLDCLSNISKYDSNIREKISIITILQYLNEIKRFFDPSSAGFLLEKFIRTLIHGEMTDQQSSVDVLGFGFDESQRFLTQGHKGIKKIEYQIKLYKKNNPIKIRMDKPCDYYIICLKDTEEKIEVFIIDGKDEGKSNYILKCATPIQGTDDDVIRFKNINNVKTPFVILSYTNISPNCDSVEIKLDEVEKLIQFLGEDLKSKISQIFDDLSELHYDIDSLMSGRDKKNNLIEIETARKNCIETLKNIGTHVSEFKFS